MANTYTQLYVHIIFAPYKRENLIRKEVSMEIYSYIGGIISNQGQKPIRINGIPDHIHILLGFSPDISLSNLIRDIKCNSTLYIKKQNLIRGFQWQTGFGAFSYNKSLLPKVSKYIENQEVHHKKQTFREEYEKMLVDAGVEYNENVYSNGIEVIKMSPRGGSNLFVKLVLSILRHSAARMMLMFFSALLIRFLQSGCCPPGALISSF